MVERDGHVQRDLLCDGIHHCWKNDIPAALGRGNATEPAGDSRSTDDDVGPGHFETAENYSCSNCDDGLSDHSTGNEANKEAEEDLVDEVGDDSDLEATETRPWAGFLTEMFNCCADSGSDGFRFNEE